MNGFISKYRWIILIIAGGLAIALIVNSRQVPDPVIVAEEPVIVVEEPVVEDAVSEVVVDEPVVETVVAPEPEPQVEEVVETVIESPPVETPVEVAPEVIEPEVIEIQEPVQEPEPVQEIVQEQEQEPVTVQEPEPELVQAEPVIDDIAEADPVIEVEPEPSSPEIEVEEPAPVVEVVEVEVEVEVEVTEELAVEPEIVVIEETTEPEAAEPETVIEEPVVEEVVVEEETSVEEIAVETSEVLDLLDDLTAEVTSSIETDTPEDGIKPSFDVVRVDASGSAVIAGSAEPFSKVVILSNGEEIGEAIAGSSGEFVAIIQVPENDQGQTLELESEVLGKLLFSDESILILPILRSAAADSLIEESAPPIIRATKDEVFIIQGAPKLGLGQVSLDSISYDDNDEVVLAGRGTPGRTVIIYVDDTPLMDTVVSDSGSWKQALHGLDAGRYVLRVDEIDDEGNVTSRVESPFQREYPEDVREAKAANDTTYTVQPGNSLWIIATGRYGDGMRYHQIFAANKGQIRDPDLIYPGQVFAIPDIPE